MSLKTRKMKHSSRSPGKPKARAGRTLYDRFRRQQRINELATTSKASKFGQVFALQKPDYKRDVTEASREAYILVLMTSSLGTNTESALASELWQELASKFGNIKFCEIRANLCVEGYPESNTPTVLIYKNGDIAKQLVTLNELGGPRTSLKGNGIRSGQG